MVAPKPTTATNANNSSSSAGPSRDLWRSARERQRLVARYQIRQRVASGGGGSSGSSSGGSSGGGGSGDVTTSNVVGDKPNRVGPDDDKNSDSCGSSNTHTQLLLSTILLAVLKGDRSKFSLAFMDRHHAVLSSPILASDFRTLKSSDIDFPNLYHHTLHLAEAWRGRDRAKDLRRHLNDNTTSFTLYEYATWMGRSSIVGALLLGGISPTQRGTVPYCVREDEGRSGSSTTNDDDDGDDDDYRNEQLARVGAAVLHRFFDSFPLRLSTYIVMRVVEARWNAVWDARRSDHERLSTCPVCSDSAISLNFRVMILPCRHASCETCLWTDLLANIDDRGTLEDVFMCPVCGTMCDTFSMIPCEAKAVTAPANTMSILNTTAIERKEASLLRFRELPNTPQTLKAQRKHIKKRKPSEADNVARNWQDAVLPSLGSSQDVRAERFVLYVDQDAIHYVRACLQAGVDVDGTNEYGQTALYIAAWRGFDHIVELLLHNGANANILANGGSTIKDVCRIHGHNRISEMIGQCCDTLTSEDMPLSILNELPSGTPPLQVTQLIPSCVDHAGAGSCLIDNAISSKMVKALLQLFHSLPVYPAQKVKKHQAPCSERSYFCDATGVVRQMLQIPLQEVANIFSSTSTVFPHMRFLNYNEEGTILAPHVDLCRWDPFHSGCDDSSDGRSTHTLILYLTDCLDGGATRLLGDVKGKGRSVAMATVTPRQGRLLLFPHSTPHEGLEVVSVPKILLRGEVRLTPAARSGL